jgi:Predicted nucleotide-binding protein containing TIR-like domain
LTSLRDVPPRLRQLDAEGRLPDVLLLDLYHPCEVDDAEALQAEAEAKLGDLNTMLAEVKTAVERAYSPAAIDVLEEIRRNTPARKLPTMIYTRRGLLLLDDADLRRVPGLDAGWLIKDPFRIQADTEGAYIEKFVERTRGAPGHAVFIGHGRSTQWQELRDFLSDDLGLPFEEFNRVASEGKTVVERLNEMLDAAAIALIVLTAEDQHADGTSVARQNVVHEAGLFAGRLGFRKAILLLEEGCADFTNVHGLVAIRYPPNTISATFDPVRRVLQRERLLD